MKKIISLRHLTLLALLLVAVSLTSAQPGPPPPPDNPPVGNMIPGPPDVPPTPPSNPMATPPSPVPPPPPPTPNPGLPNTPPGWGAAGFLANPPMGNINQGTINVMATGYDNESVLVQIPLVVSYSFNGVYYDVKVLNSWNPLTQTWNIGVDAAAYQTSYYFNGFNYNYYAVLPTGTYYFNL